MLPMQFRVRLFHASCMLLLGSLCMAVAASGGSPISAVHGRSSPFVVVASSVLWACMGSAAGSDNPSPESAVERSDPASGDAAASAKPHFPGDAERVAAPISAKANSGASFINAVAGNSGPPLAAAADSRAAPVSAAAGDDGPPLASAGGSGSSGWQPNTTAAAVDGGLTVIAAVGSSGAQPNTPAAAGDNGPPLTAAAGSDNTPSQPQRRRPATGTPRSSFMTCPKRGTMTRG